MLMFIARWLLILLLSIAIMFPPVWAIANWGMEKAEAEHRAAQPKPPAAQGMGLRGLGALVAYTVGSFIVIWPLAVWGSYRLLRSIGRARRDPEGAKPVAAQAAPPELVVTREQVLGEPVASAEGRDDGPVVAGPELDLDDAAPGVAGNRG
jgi:hypothetical protein